MLYALCRLSTTMNQRLFVEFGPGVVRVGVTATSPCRFMFRLSGRSFAASEVERIGVLIKRLVPSSSQLVFVAGSTVVAGVCDPCELCDAAVALSELILPSTDEANATQQIAAVHVAPFAEREAMFLAVAPSKLAAISPEWCDRAAIAAATIETTIETKNFAATQREVHPIAAQRIPTPRDLSEIDSEDGDDISDFATMQEERRTRVAALQKKLADSRSAAINACANVDRTVLVLARVLDELIYHARLPLPTTVAVDDENGVPEAEWRQGELRVLAIMHDREVDVFEWRAGKRMSRRIFILTGVDYVSDADTLLRAIAVTFEMLAK
jgi:hypothetical protein